MKIATVLIAAALTLAPVFAFAHGDKPPAAHGGQLQDAQGIWIELVVKGDDVVVYVVSEDHQPIAAAQISGTATVLFEGKTYKVQLIPGKENGVQGKLPVAVVGKVVATVALKIGDKLASARFPGV
jgi:hypothetical protein